MDKVLPSGSLKFIHVNVNSIRENAKSGTSKPVCRAQVGGEATYGDNITIKGPSELVYSPDKPLACGAKVWVETRAEVVVSNVRAWDEPCSI